MDADAGAHFTACRPALRRHRSEEPIEARFQDQVRMGWRRAVARPLSRDVFRAQSRHDGRMVHRYRRASDVQRFCGEGGVASLPHVPRVDGAARLSRCSGAQSDQERGVACHDIGHPVRRAGLVHGSGHRRAAPPQPARSSRRGDNRPARCPGVARRHAVGHARPAYGRHRTGRRQGAHRTREHAVCACSTSSSRSARRRSAFRPQPEAAHELKMAIEAAASRSPMELPKSGIAVPIGSVAEWTWPRGCCRSIGACATSWPRLSPRPWPCFCASWVTPRRSRASCSSSATAFHRPSAVS